MKYFGLGLFISLLFISCNNETEEIDLSSFGYDYFPVSSGKKYTYQSDSIIYLSGGLRKDTLRSFILEEIGESLKDASGVQQFKVYRSFKRKITDNWQRINTWTVSMDETSAIRNEENLNFIKLVFPIKKGLRWNGNLFLDTEIKIEVGGENLQPYKNWKHRIEEIEVDYTFKNQKFKSIKVNLVSDSSIIDFRKVTEFYGKGIGLLRKEMTILDSDGNKPTEVWVKKAQKGFIHTLTLIDVN